VQGQVGQHLLDVRLREGVRDLTDALHPDSVEVVEEGGAIEPGRDRLGSYRSESISCGGRVKHTFIVTVECEKYTNSHIVMANRLDYDEDYGFPYTVEWRDTPLRLED
jgi:hypothetical protein